MSMLKSWWVKVGVAGALAAGGLVQAAPITYNFEAFGDGTALGSQISGLSFTNALVLRAGDSLNDVEFPPHSGAAVVMDDGGAIEIQFAAPVLGVSAFFTYTVPLTIEAFDSSHQSLGSVTGTFSANTQLSGFSGSSPNEELGLLFSTAQIASVRFTGDSAGASFALDDLTVEFAQGGGTVPEPQSLALVLAALAASAAVARRRRA